MTEKSIKKKDYEIPELEIIDLPNSDIITNSQQTESQPTWGTSNNYDPDAWV